MAGNILQEGTKILMNEISARRASVLELEDAINAHPDRLASDSAPLVHHFAPGCYGREITMKADTCVIGKLHKHGHINVLLEGECIVKTENGDEKLVAPMTWVSEPGIKRAVYNITDVRWLTIHPTNETDLDKIEAEVIAPTYDNLLEAT